MAVEALTIRAIGNSSGVVLPKELLEMLKVKQGDKLFVSQAPGGIKLTAYNDVAAAQLDIARKIMRERRDLLRELAK